MSGNGRTVEDSRWRTERKLATALWGLFFIWVGLVLLLKAGVGAGLLGIGAIALGIQAVRMFMGLNLEKLWLSTGLVCVLSGVWELMHTELPLVPALLIVAGFMMLLPLITGREIFRRRK